MADLRREMPCQGYTVGIFEREQLVSLPLRQMSATGALAGFSNRRFVGHFPGLPRKLPIPICSRQSI
jgi:hypothetical protein